MRLKQFKETKSNIVNVQCEYSSERHHRLKLSVPSKMIEIVLRIHIQKILEEKELESLTIDKIYFDTATENYNTLVRRYKIMKELEINFGLPGKNMIKIDYSSFQEQVEKTKKQNQKMQNDSRDHSLDRRLQNINPPSNEADVKEPTNIDTSETANYEEGEQDHDAQPQYQ